jgi:hypothetical protein
MSAAFGGELGSLITASSNDNSLSLLNHIGYFSINQLG